MTPFDLVLERLSESGHPAKKVGNTWMARCPAHPDNNPSLAINTGRDNNAILHCHAGCDVNDVLQAIQLTRKDLFTPKDTPSGLGDVIASYTYTDADGQPVLRVNRFHPKTFRQQHWNGTAWIKGAGNTPKLLYRLPTVRTACEQGGTIWLAEGEKDVHALENAGVIATCNAGGAGKFYATHAHQLTGASLIIIVVDNDTAGYDHARKVATELILENIPYKFVMAAEGKDAADHLNAGHGLDEFVSIATLGDTEEPEPADEDDEPSEDLHGWEPTDISDVLAADYTPPRPTILKRADGSALLYAGRMNAIYGESGSGKSWVAMVGCAQELNAGRSVIYIDLEDHVGSVIARMMSLGADKTALIERFTYISPLGAWKRNVSEFLVGRCLERDVSLVVIDSTGEAMALDGAKPNDDDDTARWFRRVPRTLARTGAAVLLLDHMPKSTDAPQGFAIGSQRKRAAIDGASYRVDVGVAPARGIEGHLRLITAKDRGGTYQHGHKAADIDIIDTPTGTTVTIKPPGNGLPTVLMTRISQYLDATPGASARNVEDNVSGRGQHVRNALNLLVDHGYVSRTPRTGKHGGFEHHNIKPFEELDGYVTPDETTPESQPRPPRPNRVPETGTHLPDLTASPRPPIHTNRGTGTRLESPPDTPKTPTASPETGRGQTTLAATGTDNPTSTPDEEFTL